jgi:hypothetical protein
VFREVDIDVDQASWPVPPALPAFPPSFHVGSATEDISITAMLLMIGYLTTPSSVTGVSLSEFWAWVRYLAAFTNDTDMRLTSGFASLDSHQKTILSDDFGMGLPMLWLDQRLGFVEICDGRYFIQYVAASAHATARRTAKRGPNKSPDFVARDASGVWHVIECKGTQSGPDYSQRQMSDGDPQKRSIVFPSSHTGQRLVCGLSIAVHDSQFPTTLTITDPPPELEEAFELGQHDLAFAEDAAARSVVSKSLRLAGFEAAADTTSSPFGRSPATRPTSFRRAEEARKRDVEERDQRAREELDARADREVLPELGHQFRGRRLIFNLPRPVTVGEDRIFTVKVSQGVNEEVLAELSERPTVETPLTESDLNWRSAVGRTTVEADERQASMQIGEVFRSHITLA